MSYEQSYGYPSIADVITALAARGVELPVEGNPNYTDQAKCTVWSILNAVDWATALGVWLPSAMTFNVRGGKYLINGTVKTYSPASAVDPVDNDTTYVWMTDANAIGYGIDGDGWPGTEHIKLAEIDVDSDGVITDVRDLRGQTFMTHATMPAGDVVGTTDSQTLTNKTMDGDSNTLSNISGKQAKNIGADGGVPVIFTATLTAGSTVQIHNANAPYKYRVIDAWSVAVSADGGTWKITDGTNDITDAVAVTATDKTIDRAGTIDDAYHEIAANGSLSVVGDGANADVTVYVKAIRVA